MSPELRRDFIGLVAEGVSGPVVYEPGTSQYQAVDWLVDSDPDYLCPDDVTLLNRYIMVVFYYSTEGATWTRCRAPEAWDPETEEASNEACPDGNAWLTSGTVCDWYGVTCDGTQEITELDIGTLRNVKDYLVVVNLPICLTIVLPMVCTHRFEQSPG